MATTGVKFFRVASLTGVTGVTGAIYFVHDNTKHGETGTGAQHGDIYICTDANTFEKYTADVTNVVITDGGSPYTGSKLTVSYKDGTSKEYSVATSEDLEALAAAFQNTIEGLDVTGYAQGSAVVGTTAGQASFTVSGIKEENGKIGVDSSKDTTYTIKAGDNITLSTDGNTITIAGEESGVKSLDAIGTGITITPAKAEGAAGSKGDVKITLADATAGETEAASTGGAMTGAQAYKLENISTEANKSDIAYDDTNKKITKTIDGTPADVVTASKIVTDGGAVTKVSSTNTNALTVDDTTIANEAKLTVVTNSDVTATNKIATMSDITTEIGKLNTGETPIVISKVETDATTGAQTYTFETGIKEENGVVKVDGVSPEVTLYTSKTVTSTNRLVTQDEISSITGVMHFKGTTADPTAVTKAETGDVYIISGAATGATYTDGQEVVCTAVDASGKPTAWEVLGDQNNQVTSIIGNAAGSVAAKGPVTIGGDKVTATSTATGVTLNIAEKAITGAELSDDVNASLAKADSALQEVEAGTGISISTKADNKQTITNDGVITTTVDKGKMSVQTGSATAVKYDVVQSVVKGTGETLIDVTTTDGTATISSTTALSTAVTNANNSVQSVTEDTDGKGIITVTKLTNGTSGTTTINVVKGATLTSTVGTPTTAVDLTVTDGKIQMNTMSVYSATNPIATKSDIEAAGLVWESFA